MRILPSSPISNPVVAAAVAAPAVTDITTTPADLAAMGTAFRAEPVRAQSIGPVQGRYDLKVHDPVNDTDTPITGSARVYHARVGTDEWALVPFFNPFTGFMHQPAVLHKVDGHWTVPFDDPAPGEYDKLIPEALVSHWGIVNGMPPADSVTDDNFPE